MEQIQVFKNEEFGEIRTVVIDNEPWFVGIEIAKALGYAVPKTATAKHVDKDDMQSTQIGYQGQMREMIVINESGLYSLIFGSKLENAKKFKKWVTSEVLPSIRKTGSYQIPQTTDGKIALLAKGHLELKEEVDSIKSELEMLKMDLPILPIEESKITEAVKRKGVAILGGKLSPAYNNRNLRQKLYNNLYANLKYNFNVRSYRAIKRIECEKAIEIVNAYQPPFYLAQTIENENAQQSLF